MEQETVTFAAVVYGGTGVRQVLVTANGVELWRQDNRTQQPSMAVNLPVKLAEGQNTLVVTATETDGTDPPGDAHDPPREADAARGGRALPGGSRARDRRGERGGGGGALQQGHQPDHGHAQRDRGASAGRAEPAEVDGGERAAHPARGRERHRDHRARARRRRPPGGAHGHPGARQARRPGAGAARPRPPRRRPRQWAVVIGVGGYENSAIPRAALLGGRRRRDLPDAHQPRRLQEGQRAAAHRQDRAQAHAAQHQVGARHVPRAARPRRTTR